MDTPEPAIPSLALDPAVLTCVMQTALGSGTAAIERWQVRPATSSRGSATAGVYHISGTAHDHGAPVEWAVILKILRPAAAAFNPASRAIDHPLYWKRELLAYESGLLADLPGGISAPRCFAVEERADESGWLWLEHVPERYGPRWPVAQYAHAAGALGRFNGAYLAGQPLPAHAWLGSPGGMRGLLQAFAFVQDVVRDPATWQHPLLRAAFRIPIAERLLRLWADRAPLLDALDRLPQTLCHKDAFRHNMFAAADVHGQPRLVLIDWAYVGRGEIGLDAADLFGASYSTFGVEPIDLRAFDAAIFGSYVAGLHEAGWRGDPQIVRFGFAASAALKYGGLLLWLGDLVDEQRSAAWEEFSGQPLATFVHHQARLVAYLLDLADEAHDLLRGVIGFA
jgi:hypothetical protein